MDKALKTIPGVGEVGVDTEASAGNGCYYVKMYDGSLDCVGYDSVEEAFTELEYAAGLRDDEPDFPLSLEYDDDGYEGELL